MQAKEGNVLTFYSAKFSKLERKYFVTRKKLLAVGKSLAHFHPYIYRAKFVIRTDHDALHWLKTLKDPKAQLARWLGHLKQFNYIRPCDSWCLHCSKEEADQSIVTLGSRGEPAKLVRSGRMHGKLT